MAKIKTFTFKDLEKKDVKVDLHFNIDANGLYFFLEQIPQEVLKYCPNKPNTQRVNRKEAVFVKDAKDAEIKISELFNIAYLNYRDGNKTKIIFYKFQIEGKIGDTYEKDVHFGIKEPEDNFSHRELHYTWGICYSLKGINGNVYLNEDGSENHHLKYNKRETNIIQWTEEKEAFFKNLDLAYEKLSEKLRAFRDTDKEEFEKLIQSSSAIKLLPEIK